MSQNPLLDRADSCSLAATESGAGLSGDCGNCGSSGCLAGQGVHQRQGSDGTHLRTHYDSGSLKDRSKRSSHKNALNVSIPDSWIGFYQEVLRSLHSLPNAADKSGTD